MQIPLVLYSAHLLPIGSTNENFHLLVDVGEGVAESLEKSRTDITSQSKIISDIPNAVLITDFHHDQIKDLPKLFNKVMVGSDKFGVYCTKAVVIKL